MKAVYIILLVVGSVLLLATEGSIIVTLTGLALVGLSALKLGLFKEHEY